MKTKIVLMLVVATAMLTGGWPEWMRKFKDY